MGDDVIEVVERSNQRGGRMLSVVDLIAAETLTLELAAWLAERIEAGSSFLVGANPGGAGKTAVMGALLIMLPHEGKIYVSRHRGGWEEAKPGDCVVAYEISPASYEGYIWGGACKRFASLGLQGVRLAANLHADTYQEARSQLTKDNGLTEEEADAFDIFVPITVRSSFRRMERRVEQVHLCGAEGENAVVGRTPRLSRRGGEIAEFLQGCLRRKLFHIEEVRPEWLRFLEKVSHVAARQPKQRK